MAKESASCSPKPLEDEDADDDVDDDVDDDKPLDEDEEKVELMPELELELKDDEEEEEEEEEENEVTSSPGAVAENEELLMMWERTTEGPGRSYPVKLLLTKLLVMTVAGTTGPVLLGEPASLRGPTISGSLLTSHVRIPPHQPLSQHVSTALGTPPGHISPRSVRLQNMSELQHPPTHLLSALESSRPGQTDPIGARSPSKIVKCELDP